MSSLCPRYFLYICFTSETHSILFPLGEQGWEGTIQVPQGRTDAKVILVVPLHACHCLLRLFILVSPSKAGLCNDFSLISVTYSGLLCSSAIVDHYVWCAKSQCTCCAPVLPSQWKNPKIVPKSLFLHLIAVSPAVSNAGARTSWRFVQCSFHIDPSQ